ncbi:MAG: family 20 glycosylhydrolase [Clostridium sp.]|uniref:family 20 glycosylhydrolase n=1 Tax=Clostridium sp. TaxID=1506 RepID=UPI003F3DA513
MKKLLFMWGTILVGVIVFTFGIFLMSKKGSEEVGTEEVKNIILPVPLSYVEKDGAFEINEKTKISLVGNDKEGLEKNSRELKRILKGTGISFEVNSKKVEENYIQLKITKDKEDIGNEGYEISVGEKGILIEGKTAEGIFRGLQTFRQIAPEELEDSNSKDIKAVIPFVEIKDSPEYEYRGIMLDVARHFFSVEEVKRQIDILSRYKVNKLHLHLSDDQGFRLEMKKYPKLTEIGGKTSVGGGEGGYYTQEDFKEIVEYANERYIEVIPEFDMPGHTTAMLASYDFLNPNGIKKEVYTGIEVGISSLMCRDEKTYEFIEDIIKEVVEISPSKYIHIGGDETHVTPKKDYDYFVGRVSKMVQSYGKTPIGWDPIDTSSEIDNRTVLQNWKDSNEEGTKKEMKMIISIASKAYLDMKYDSTTPYGLSWAGHNSIKDSYNWDPTDFAKKELVLGVEAALFAETIETREGMDYMIYPRMLGHAEIGWSKKENRDYKDYVRRLKKHATRLEKLGVVNFMKYAKYN